MDDGTLDFAGKVVAITGAASGIGAACARLFCDHGAAVAIGDIDLEKAGAVVNSIEARGRGEAHAIRCDVSDDEACRRFLDQTIARFGRLDVLVNNAAILAKGSVIDLSPDDFDRVLRVNLRAPFVLSQHAARIMIAAGGGGAIVNLSSLNAILAIPNQLAYVTSKGGLTQLTKASALALAEHGVRVNAVAPGSIMTDLLKTVMSDEAARRMILSRTPLGRVGEVEEIASIVLFLASPMASYITGETIVADGGRAALNYTAPVAETEG